MAILHITFSLSTQGSIKHAIRQNHLQREESVICIHDNFSIGPLTSMEERKNWLDTHIFKDVEEQELYEDIHNKWTKAIAGIPCDLDVWIWYSQNAHEEIALRYVMSEFVNKCSMVFGIDATAGLQRIQQDMAIRYTGELSSDMLMKLRPEAKRFTIEECQRLAKEWDELKRNQSILRVWQNGIVHVEESEFDINIINSAKYLQASNKEQWLSPVNVIGQMVNITDDYINETFIENRLLYLAQQGLFEISGDTTDINAYKINYIGQ
ncbi:DUF1835 domain-containing protein [Lysinibacillus sphaericus]|uniref:Domain of uncharacterized function (DUF1835) n=1 Tax=Lysinibacillus sphaericus TaxID=1421 RepID=A0A2S0K226_LYSSH|nr:DUF1835 domain-containing protein [Lysinibacillus sphaericus]AVK97324.1 hypothetical protein LS41612_14155 [Lysinibacillus sphaericus]MED4542629.1 DUF1835 domain-containing protein [Lysinibacillus sphaericus]TKI19988.1 DUF1835 domain-containing protein [Lysinibacillus sphaericus]SUV16782.1 Domain of uncharacterised function (DUF1835) [Lysinibacillus sphaericus]GEC80416.1 hypothetical protein LSP03_01590 [Lysinibacillus sphaericus]